MRRSIVRVGKWAAGILATVVAAFLVKHLVDWEPARTAAMREGLRDVQALNAKIFGKGQNSTAILGYLEDSVRLTLPDVIQRVRPQLSKEGQTRIDKEMATLLDAADALAKLKQRDRQVGDVPDAASSAISIRGSIARIEALLSSEM